MSTKVKICGITNLSDALLAKELGADLLGFNFYRPSPRYIEPQAAADIIAELPGDIVTVGVFVNASVAEIEKLLEECPLQVAQLHGDENNDDCREVARLGVRVMKALRLRQREDIEQAKEFEVDMLLLDAFREELYGGTGHKFDWNWVKQAGREKIFLAGGITPENVTEALAVGTYGIDLASGVEKEPGIKDHDRMKLLFEKINRFNHAG